MLSDHSAAVLAVGAVLLVAAVVLAAVLVRRASVSPGRRASVPGRRTSAPGRGPRQKDRRPPAAPGRRPQRVHPRPPSASWESRPAPGQIWWADVPYEEGTGSKVRPCLVVRTHPRSVEVLKITSQDKSRRDGYLRIPTAEWDPRATKDSWLEVSETHILRDRDFRDRAAASCDARTWKQVTRLQETGWVYDN